MNKFWPQRNEKFPWAKISQMKTCFPTECRTRQLLFSKLSRAIPNKK